MKIYVVYKYFVDYDSKEVDMIRAFASEKGAEDYIKGGERYGVFGLQYKEVELEVK